MLNTASALDPFRLNVAPWGGVTLRAQGTRTPLFLVHDGTGDETWFARLVEHVASDVPVCGLPPDETAARRPHTIEGMATRLLATMRSKQPRGPYRLLGAGLGGVLAYEMAVQLIGQDQAVEFVGLLDSQFPDWPQGRVTEENPSLVRTTESLHRYAQAVARYAIQPMPLTLHLIVSAGKNPAQSAPVDTAAPAQQGWASLVPRLQVWHADDEGQGALGMGRALSRAMLDAAGSLASPAERRHGAHVVIQSGRRGEVPVVCVPGAGDSVIGFIPLSDALGPEFPLHGLQPRGVEGLLVPHATVEAAASFYLDATLAMRRGGPVHLIGHSFGGWVAFEMALQLHARGQSVASLTIIDSEAPDGIGVLGNEYGSTEALIELIRVMELSAGKRLGQVFNDIQRCGRGEQLRLLHEGMVRIGLLPKRSDPSAVRGLARTFGTALRTTYRPTQVYRGPVGLVLARNPTEDNSQNQRSQSSMLCGWKSWAPDVHGWSAPGDHFSVLRQPHVKALAQWWLGRIGRGQVDARALQIGQPQAVG